MALGDYQYRQLQERINSGEIQPRPSSWGLDNLGATGRAIGNSPVGDYFMADIRAGRENQKAANNAQGYVQEYGGMALDTMNNMAGPGRADYGNYRDKVYGGDFNMRNPGQYQTGQYGGGQGGNGLDMNRLNQGLADGSISQADYGKYMQGGQGGGYGQNAPGFQQFNQGQMGNYNAPQMQNFQRGQDPQFQRADAGNFQFDYQKSPGFDFQMKQELEAIGSRASAKGARFGAGRDKDSMAFAQGLAAQDYGNEYNRARGAFEQDRGFGERQSGSENIFNQGGYQFGAGLDQNQNQYGNNYNQRNSEYGAGYNQNNFQYGQNMGNQNNMWAQNMGNQNYWNQQEMQQNENQFMADYNMNANAQNYDMANQQNQWNAGLWGGLANQGYDSQVNLANMQAGYGDSLANAALGVGNANANRAMGTRNTVNDTLNTLANVGSAGAAIYGAGRKK